MQTRPWTQALIGTAAMVVLAGCSSPSSSAEEPEPGEIDWDVAVTRTALISGIDPADGTYNPWQHEVVDFSEANPNVPLSDEHLEAGLELLCKQLDHGDSDPIASLYLGTVAQEAVHGAVLATASEEFRTANSVLLVQASQLAGGDPPQEVQDAIDAMTGDLNEEWAELYELQTKLEEEVFSVEGAKAAQAAVAERCDVTIDDDDVVNDPAPRFSPSLVHPPQTSASGADQ